MSHNPAAPSTSVPPVASIPRCKHDTEMVNEANERRTKALAVLDPLVCMNDSSFAENTISCASWVAHDLMHEGKQTIGETEVQA